MICITAIDYIIAAGGNSGHGHAHDREYEFHFVIDGEGTFQNGERTSTLRQYQLFFSTPEESHAAGPAGRIQFYYLRFTADTALVSLLRDLHTVFTPSGYIQLSETDLFLFENIRRKLRSENDRLRRSANHECMAFMYELSQKKTTRGGGTINPYVRRLIRLMHDRVDQRLLLSEAAAEMNIDAAYLSRLFRTHVGMPPSRYFMKLKIDCAAYYLRASRLPIRKIAARLDFYDEFHLSKTFKSLTGQSPRQYRKTELA